MRPSKAVLVITAVFICGSATAQGLFPSGRLIDRDRSAVAAAVVEEIGTARDAVVDSASRSTYTDFWRLAQRLSLFVSQVEARFDTESSAYSKLHADDQALLRDGYLIIDLVSGFMGGSLSDSSLADRAISDALNRLAARSERGPVLLEVEPVWLIASSPPETVDVSFGGVRFLSTDQRPYLEVDGKETAASPDSISEGISFEVPTTLSFPDEGVSNIWVDVVVFERRKRNVFRSHVVPMKIRIPIFTIPERLASFDVTATVEVSTSDTRTRRSVAAHAEGIGAEANDRICVNAKKGWQIIPESAVVHKTTDEEWEPDLVLSGQWNPVKGTANTFSRTATESRVCINVSSKPSEASNMAVAEAYIEFTEQTGTTTSEDVRLSGTLLWTGAATLDLPENTISFRIDLSFFDQVTESLEGPGDSRWASVSYDETTHTLTFAPKSF